MIKLKTVKQQQVFEGKKNRFLIKSSNSCDDKSFIASTPGHKVSISYKANFYITWSAYYKNKIAISFILNEGRIRRDL